MPHIASPAITTRHALIADARAIQELIEWWSRRSTVLPKSLGQIYENIREFHVACDEGKVVGCAGLHVDWEDLAELRSVAVAPELVGKGVGSILVRATLADARRLGLQKVFCLTDQPGWFARLGFVAIDREILPHKVWRDCIHCPSFPECKETAMMVDLNVHA